MRRGSGLLLCTVIFVLSACAADPPPEPAPPAATPPEKSGEAGPPALPPQNVQKQAASNPCRGLVQTSCGKLKSCEWIKNDKPVNKNDQAPVDYCRLKVASTVKK